MGDDVARRRGRLVLVMSVPDVVVPAVRPVHGDIWTVEQRHRDGDLTVRHHRHGGCVRLPADYVAESVELGYATTTARAQGMTVDTAHVLVDANTCRESLYVAATRGRHGARIYVANEDLIGIDAERPPLPSERERSIQQRRGRRACLPSTDARQASANLMCDTWTRGSRLLGRSRAARGGHAARRRRLIVSNTTAVAPWMP